MKDMPEEFWQGVEQFNQQEFYACHDTLEAIWINALPDEKNFYQGILQIAVALHHLSNYNWRGAVILMGEGTNRLRTYQSDYGGIDVDRFVDETGVLLKQLQVAGPDRVEAIAQQLGLSSTDNVNFSAPEALQLPRIQKWGMSNG
ncbi:MAG: DUF309 domain-containing protein [Oscillatoriales cyanobacterium C42_A2020_001]|nr:DUF309 domain-containing protein [Leptolyngbyaceae cyanobacterium C42_A2020_001]